MKLDALKFGVSAGIVWGVAVFLLDIVAKRTGYGLGLINALGTIYIGVQPTPVGEILGLIYGFCDAFIGFYLFALIYNKLVDRK